jgi:hypothetical protein
MAVQSDTSSISYTGNNSTVTSYAVPFVFLENGHLQAIAKVTATGVETAVTLTNHTGAGDPNGGTVRTAVAVPATSTLTIFRIVPATQTTSYQEGGDFPAASHERALDKLTFLAQQSERANDRAIRVTEVDGSRNDMVAVANTVIGLDGLKNPRALTASELKTFLALTGVTLDVDAGTKTFLDAGERALTVPDFTGQLGTQRDTQKVYISNGISAGSWILVELALADLTSGFFTADATGRGKFGGGFVDAGLLASDAVTTAKILDANVTDAKLASGIDASKITTGTLPADRIGANAITTARILDANVTPAKLSQRLTMATAVATTSGTSIDFTGIPSWVKRITVILNGVSTNGTANIFLYLGDSGGFETSNYTVNSFLTTSAGGISATFPTGSPNAFVWFCGNAANANTGHWILTNISGNIWIATHQGLSSITNYVAGAGLKTLSDTLTQIRLTTANGTDTFDAGEVNIMYEG